MKLLEGQVALVAGATRGAGRGIARGLAEAGALVYCTGRSVRGSRSPYGRPETIDETAELIAASGGQAVAVQVDHTVEADVAALFDRILRDSGLTPEESLCELVLWNETHASPPWSAHELLHKVQSAFQFSAGQLKGTASDE